MRFCIEHILGRLIKSFKVFEDFRDLPQATQIRLLKVSFSYRFVWLDFFAFLSHKINFFGETAEPISAPTISNNFSSFFTTQYVC